MVKEKSILVTCIAGSLKSIGTVCLTNREVSFNQQINGIILKKEIVNSFFTYYLLKYSKNKIQDFASNGMKHIITKSVFEKIPLILPPLSLQQEFAAIVEKIEEEKALAQTALKQSEDLFQRLMQDLFPSPSSQASVVERNHLEAVQTTI